MNLKARPSPSQVLLDPATGAPTHLYNGAQPRYDPALGADCDVGEACRTFTMVTELGGGADRADLGP